MRTRHCAHRRALVVLFVLFLSACGQSQRRTGELLPPPTIVETVSPLPPLPAATVPVTSLPSPTPSVIVETANAIPSTATAIVELTPLLSPTPVTALSPMLPPDRAKEWSEIELGSREWYTHISISPTLDLVWSGASDAVNIPHTVPVEAVAVDRQRAFVGVAQAEDQGALLIFDVSNPAAPTQRAYLPQPGYGAIRLADGLALIAAGRTLQIVDVSDSDHPTVRGSVEAPGWMLGLSLAAHRAYVTTQGNDNGGRGALSIFDISDNTRPTLLGRATTLGPAPRGVLVRDTFAYVADTSSLVIVDVSNPGAPKRIGSYELSSEVAQGMLGPEYKAVLLSAESVQVIGPRAYLGTNVGVVILDVSNLAKPALLGSYTKTGPYSISDIEVTADRAYMTFANWGSSDFGGMDVVDISDPTHPKLVGGYTTNANAYDVQVVDQFIYVANGRRGLLIFRLQS